MSNTELIAALKHAAKRADYYQTGERGLLERAADALQTAEQRLADAWDEGAQSAYYDPETRDRVSYPDNPYRVQP